MPLEDRNLQRALLLFHTATTRTKNSGCYLLAREGSFGETHRPKNAKTLTTNLIDTMYKVGMLLLRADFGIPRPDDCDISYQESE